MVLTPEQRQAKRTLKKHARKVAKQYGGTKRMRKSFAKLLVARYMEQEDGEADRLQSGHRHDHL